MSPFRTTLAALGVAALAALLPSAPAAATTSATAPSGASTAPAATAPVATAPAPLDAVTSLTIASPDPADPTAPLTVGQQFRVDATWALPPTARPGDTFAVSFPSPVEGWTSSFALRDASGEEVGTCTVQSSAFECTLGEYVAHHTDISGSLFFSASAVATSGDTLLFTSSSGTVYRVDAPGGGIGTGTGSPATAPPTALAKGGWQNADGSLGWLIFLPGAQLVHAGQEVVVTDTWDARLTLVPGSLSVERVADADWNGGAWSGFSTRLSEGDAPGTFTAAVAQPSVALTVHAPDPRSTYVVSYRLAVPAGTPDGTVFGNSVRGDGMGSDQAAVAYIAAGGVATGQDARDLAVTKRVDGAGAAPGGTYPIAVACTADGGPVPGFPATASLAAGETRVFPRVPVGATCTVRETDSRGASTVTYSPAASLTVAAGDGPVEVTVTNTFAAAPAGPGGSPSTPAAGTGGPTSATPAATGTAPIATDPATASSPTTDLAHTGSDATPALAAGMAAGLALLAGGALLARARAHRTRRAH